MKPLGFPPRLRVRKRSEFESVYSAGTKTVGRHCVLFARPNGTSESRLGVTATRKIGNAVRRNLAKRRVREAFRHARPDLPAGFDYVVVVRHRLFSAAPGVLDQELQTLALQGTR